mgnify:CR=1
MVTISWLVMMVALGLVLAIGMNMGNGIWEYATEKGVPAIKQRFQNWQDKRNNKASWVQPETELED